MGFRFLVRDQEVDGSNPFAPTISFDLASQSSVDFGTIPGWFSVLVRQEGHEMWRGSAACLKNGLAWCVELKCRPAGRFAEFTRLATARAQLCGDFRPLLRQGEGAQVQTLSAP